MTHNHKFKNLNEPKRASAPASALSLSGISYSSTKAQSMAVFGPKKSFKSSTKPALRSVIGPKKKNTRSTSLMTQKKCANCKLAIFGRKSGVEGPNGRVYHPNCFRCSDCDNELQPKQWREYPVHRKSQGKTTIALCPSCVTKRDEQLFSQHQENLNSISECI